MKARGVFVLLLIILIYAVMFLSGCGSNSPSSAKAIISYSVNGVDGTINESEKTIVVNVPSLTNIYSLVATFTTTGLRVKIGETEQKSGVTANNFISPLAYTVTAVDGSSATYTVTVTVNHAWHHPINLADNISPDSQDDADGVHVAMDNNGNIIIVWQQDDGTNWQIFKSEYRNGVWTHPASLSDNISPDGQPARNPQIAMDNNGNAIIVWSQYYGANYQIFKSEYRNGVWTHPASLSDNISPDGASDSWSYSPQVAMDNNGNAIIVWTQANKIFKSEYRNGAWHHPVSLSDNINPNGISVFEPPYVAMDNNGNAIIVWSQYDGVRASQIFKSEYRNGTWRHPASLSDNISPDGQDAKFPHVAMDNNGNAIIVWSQYDGSNGQIFKSEFRNGTWIHPAGLSDNISPDGQNACFPKLAMDNNGNAIIVWYQNDGVYDQIFKSEYRNGAWTHPANLQDNISPDGQNAYFYTQVAMDDNGNAIIVWNQSDGTGTNWAIFKSEYRNSIWTNPASRTDYISPNGQGIFHDAYYPYAVMDNSGNAIIVWFQAYENNDFAIFKSEYR